MYKVLDALVVRVAVCAPGQLPPWPDLTGPGASASWRPWLKQVLAMPELGPALHHASPTLMARVRETCDGADVTDRDARRVALAVMRYLLRATGRATPYGLFAGVAPAKTGSVATVSLGTAHCSVARLSAQWLSAVLDRAEADGRIRTQLMVRANNLLIQRGGHIVLEHRASSTPGGPPGHLLVRVTGPLRAALTLSRDPVRWCDLAEKLAVECNADTATVDALLAQMLGQRLLLSSLRPPMTTTVPLATISREADRLLGDTAGTGDAADQAEAGALAVGMPDLTGQVTRHDRSPAAAATVLRRYLREPVDAVSATHDAAVGVDLRVDCNLTVPHVVTAEAAQAAGILVRLSRRADTGWADWHRRFLERYGPHALVPLLDVVDTDIGLGYPAGFQGGPPTPAASLTDRDRKLLALAQRAALTRQLEILLDDATITELASDDPVTSVQPSTELTVRVHAKSTAAIGRGEFRLAIVAVSRHAGTTTGRFLDLFDRADQHRMAGAYADVAPITRAAVRAQISAATPYTVTADVARSPQVLPHLIPVGEYHDNNPNHIALHDIAVTADVHRVYLVSLSRRQVVEPTVFNAVEPVHHTLPIVRLLTEAPNALGAACTVFDWGAAADLPFLPAVRYRRTILSPARWVLTATQLPDTQTDWPHWTAALTRWRDTHACPATVHLGEGDQRIRLDLNHPAHQALLRDHLTRTATALLRGAPAADVDGWFDGRPHEIVIPLAATFAAVPGPRLPERLQAVAVREHGHLPGADGRCYVKLYGHRDRQTILLTEHLPVLLEQLGADVRWWFLRYGDPQPHLRLRIIGRHDPATVTEWARHLRHIGLIARIQYDTDYPETARFGGPTALAAAEDVFATDSAAALAQLTAINSQRGPDLLALSAASMLDLTTGLLGNPTEAMRWLIANTRAHRPAPPRPTYDQAVDLANPHSTAAMRSVAGAGADQILTCWQQRRTALARYRDALNATATTPATLLPDLLHLHHTRMAGVALDSERACLHLTRAAALSWTTRARNRS